MRQYFSDTLTDNNSNDILDGGLGVNSGENSGGGRYTIPTRGSSGGGRFTIPIRGNSGGAINTPTNGNSGGGRNTITLNGNSDGGSYNGSQIIEPDLINPIVFLNDTPNGSSQSQQVVDNILSQKEENKNTESQTDAPKTDVISSETTDETKRYVSGGTSPDSQIVVKKPKPNYLIFGLLGLVGIYVVYKVFFNKKSE